MFAVSIDGFSREILGGFLHPAFISSKAYMKNDGNYDLSIPF
jgi:hypothetical protein